MAENPQTDERIIQKNQRLMRNMNDLLNHLVVLADAGLIVESRTAKVVDLTQIVKEVADKTIPNEVKVGDSVYAKETI